MTTFFEICQQAIVDRAHLVLKRNDALLLNALVEQDVGLMGAARKRRDLITNTLAAIESADSLARLEAVAPSTLFDD